MPLAAATAASFWLAPLVSYQKPLGLAAAMTGLLGVVCSAMIYADTRREFWSPTQCFGKFLGTTVLLGAATWLVFSSLMTPTANSEAIILVGVLLVTMMAKLGLENRIFRHWADEDTFRLTSLNKTARLLTGELGMIQRFRVMCGVFGGVVLPVLLLVNRASSSASIAWLAPLALVLCLIGELLERYLFFTAVAPTGMPGGVAA